MSRHRARQSLADFSRISECDHGRDNDHPAGSILAGPRISVVKSTTNRRRRTEPASSANAAPGWNNFHNATDGAAASRQRSGRLAAA